MGFNTKLFRAYIYLFLVVVFTYVATYWVGYSRGYEKAKNIIHPEPIQMVTGDVQTRTITKFIYAPKTETAPADINANIGKTEISLRVNGETTTFNKSVDEKSLFDKNQVSLEQTSKVSFAVSVTPIDLTKHYGFGLGFDKDGVNAQISFPALGALDATVQASTTRLGAGFLIRF